jgi:hypothetical protein
MGLVGAIYGAIPILLGDVEYVKFNMKRFK